ncbi:hypothetical protein Tco_0753535 [Tanacetum coccineum]
MANDNENIIIISSNSLDLDSNSNSSISSDLQSTDEPSFFDTSTSKENVNSSADIVSSKGQSKSLLNWYEDVSDEYKKRLWFSKSGGKDQPSGSKAKALGSKAKASGSKAKASPKTLTVKSLVPITNCVLGLANDKTWDAILNKAFRVKYEIKHKIL